MFYIWLCSVWYLSETVYVTMNVRFIVPGMSFRVRVRVRVRGLVLGPMGPGASAPLGGPRAQT